MSISEQEKENLKLVYGNGMNELITDIPWLFKINRYSSGETTSLFSFLRHCSVEVPLYIGVGRGGNLLPPLPPHPIIHPHFPIISM